MRLTRGLAVVGTVSVLLSVPVVDVARGDTPHPVTGEDLEIPVVDGRSIAAAAAGTFIGSASEVTELTVGDAALVGVAFEEDPVATAVQVRVEEDGGWSPWTPLDVEDSAADPGTPDAAGARIASEPLWIGEGEGDRKVQVKMLRTDAASASLAAVDPGESAADDDVVARGPAARASAAAIGAPPIRSRAQWGADESLRRCDPDAASTVRAAVLHHTAGASDYTQDQVPGIIRSMYRYHTQTQGWCDLGYNVVVDRFGGIWEGRSGGLDRAVIGAHTGGFNEGTFGVSMIGTYTSAAPSAATVESVARVMAWKLGGHYRDARDTARLTSAGGSSSRYPAGQSVTVPTIFAHRDTNKTDCPGDGGYSVLPKIRNRVVELAGAPSGVVYDKWLSEDGPSGPLGEPAVVEGGTRDGGRFNHFQGGSVYWTPATGAQAVGGAIRGRWASLGWERSRLGYPVTDELATPDRRGRYTHFQGGSIYWSPSTGAWQVGGAIRARWADLGWENSALGYPVTNELATPDRRGRYTHFQGGSIYWTPATGAHPVLAETRAEWAALGWETSRLGYPVTGTARTPDRSGTYQHFQSGSIYWSPSTGAHAVRGAIRDTWAAMGWERSALGYPTTRGLGTPDGRGVYNHFQRGSVYWTEATGAHAVSGPIRDAWAARGWETSSLGYPVAGAVGGPGGTTSQAFQGGTITWSPTAGATVSR
jgi:uncharacterized protein with LGFP repeats